MSHSPVALSIMAHFGDKFMTQKTLAQYAGLLVLPMTAIAADEGSGKSGAPRTPHFKAIATTTCCIIVA